MRNHRQSGFTLMELLIGSLLLGLLTLLVNNILFNVFKATTKSEVLKEVKQNGDYALFVMERMIRNAEKILQNSDGQTCTSGMGKMKIQNFDEGTTEFALNSGKIASNSSYLTGETVSVSNLLFNCSQTVGKPPTITINFTLKQKGTAARKEEEAIISFQTTVFLRNY